MPDWYVESQPRVLRDKTLYGTFSEAKKMALRGRYRARGIRLHFAPDWAADPRHKQNTEGGDDVA